MGEPSYHFKSDSLTPYRVTVPTQSKPYASTSQSIPNLTTKSTEVGVIGSTFLHSRSTAAYRMLRSVGYGNVGDFSAGFSVLIRVIPRFTGFVTASQGGLWAMNGAVNANYFMARCLSDGRLQVSAVGADFNTMVNTVSVSTHSFTSGTAVDIFYSFNGTNGANGSKIYINGTLLVQGAASASTLYADSKGQLLESIQFPNAWPQGETGNFDVNEFVVWNEVIDPTASGLNFNGPSRASFVTSTSATALAVLPPVGDVKLGTPFGVALALTGTRTDANENFVIDTHSYGDPGAQTTGDYKAAPLDKVEEGYAFGADSSETGTLNIPYSSDPGVGNVADGVDYTIDDVDLVGELFIGAFYNDLRGFLNFNFQFIGEPSLTNDEFDTVDIDNPDLEYTLETYEALIAILETRDSISDSQPRLKKLFESTGLIIDEITPTENESEILFGGGTEDSDVDPVGYSNILMGGSVED